MQHNRKTAIFSDKILAHNAKTDINVRVMCDVLEINYRPIFLPATYFLGNLKYDVFLFVCPLLLYLKETVLRSLLDNNDTSNI